MAVELLDITGSKQLLSDVLKELTISAVEDFAGIFLVSETFEMLHSADAIHAKAGNIQQIMQVVCNCRAPDDCIEGRGP